MYFSSLQMADEWNEIESVGKSLGQRNFTSQLDGNNDDEKLSSNDKKENDSAASLDGKSERSVDGKHDGPKESPNDKSHKKSSNNNYDKNSYHRGSRGGRGGSGYHGNSRGGHQHQKDNRKNVNEKQEENRDNEEKKHHNQKNNSGNYNHNKNKNDDGKTNFKSNNYNRDNRQNNNNNNNEYKKEKPEGSGSRDHHNHHQKEKPLKSHEQHGENKRGGNRGGHAGRGTFKKHLHEKNYIPAEPSNDENIIFGSEISSGINFDKYNQIPVNVSGENPPEAIENFEKSGLCDVLLTNIQKSGYKIPTPIQKAAIPIILGKRDLMGCAQTGSGKTAAFLLPIIHSLLEENAECVKGKPRALIISPTRELSIQIFNESRKFALHSNLKVCIIYGGTAVGYQSDNLEKGCHLLIATPGRLIDFMEKEKVLFDNLRFIVLDEADRMLELGFLDNIETVMSNKSMPNHKTRQTIMVSATFPKEIQRLAGKFLNDYIFLAVGIVGGACTDVEQKIYSVEKFEKRKKLLDILNENDPSGTMVFVETQRGADFLATFLSETKIPTTSIHGARLQREREEALNDFKSGRMKLLIATSVAARGLDIKNVVHVINYDLPKSIDEYVHRIGRTGRVGNKGKSTSFYDPEEDSMIAQDLAKILAQAEQPIPEFIQKAPTVQYNNGNTSKRNNFGGRDIRKGANNRIHKMTNKQDIPKDSEEGIPLPLTEHEEPEEEW